MSNIDLVYEVGGYKERLPATEDGIAVMVSDFIVATQKRPLLFYVGGTLIGQEPIIMKKNEPRPS